jgi:hypothetical protein
VLPPPRETARPVLGLLPALRPREDWSSARRGASIIEPPGIEELPIEDPLDDEPLDDPLDGAPPELAPPPSPPPRGTAEPVVLPFDVRSCAAHADPMVRLLTATAIAIVLPKLCRDICASETYANGIAGISEP